MEATSSTVPLCYTRLIGQINEKSVESVLTAIDGANNNDNKKLIVFSMCSAGGLLYFAQALHDAIHASKKPVICVVSGTCMSSAIMVLQAAHKRVARSKTIFMLHQSTYWRDEHTYIDEMNVLHDEWNRLHKQFVSQTIERSKISFDEFEKIAKPRKYFSAQEALDMKLIDEVNDKWVESI